MIRLTLVYVVVLISLALYVLANPDFRNVLGLKAKDIVFFTDSATKETYSDFILSLRDRLQASVHEESGIEVLPDPSTIDDNDRFFEVELATGENSVTLGIDRTNLYIVGYRVGNKSYFFKDAPSSAARHLFRNTPQWSLPFTSRYAVLGNRSSTDLGIPNLSEAIMFINENPDEMYAHKRHLIVIIQMVSEAARYPYIKSLVRSSIHRGGKYDSFLPDALMLELENIWKKISTQVQHAIEGVFQTPITLKDRNGEEKIITTVQSVLQQIAVMLFVCNSRPRMSSSISNFKANNYLKMATVKDNICTTNEVTVNIVGSDGMCIDVPDGDYTDGRILQLWPCGSQCNQQWTLMEDETIRSMSKCMSLLSGTEYVVIYTCSEIERAKTLWSIWLNGTIVSEYNQKVVTVGDSRPGTPLYAQRNRYSTKQGWRPDTSVKPFIVSILGYNDLCLQGDSDQMTIVWIAECSLNNVDQKWAIYADGTIRKFNDPCLCLTPYSSVTRDRDEIILYKCQDWREQRWIFKADGVIVHAPSGLVMEVKESDLSLRQIVILSAPTVSPNQQWSRLL